MPIKKKFQKGNKKKAVKPITVPFEVKGEYIYIRNKKYTFSSLFVMTFLIVFISIASIVLSVVNIMVNGFGVGVVYLFVSVLLFFLGMLYEKILRDSRKIAGKKTFIKRTIDKIWS